MPKVFKVSSVNFPSPKYALIFPKLSSVDILPYVNSEAGVLPSNAPYVFSSPTIVPSIGAVLIFISGKKDFAQLPQWNKTHFSSLSA